MAISMYYPSNGLKSQSCALKTSRMQSRSTNHDTATFD